MNIVSETPPYIKPEVIQKKIEDELEHSPTSTAADYLACGLDPPESIKIFDNFVATHKCNF